MIKILLSKKLGELRLTQADLARGNWNQTQYHQ